jgi:hypothetical protein
MRLNINIQYVLRESARLEKEQRHITLLIAAWVQRCAALQAFSAALTSEERSHVSVERERRRTRRARTRKQVSAVVENEPSKGGDNARRTTTECALQSAR